MTTKKRPVGRPVGWRTTNPRVHINTTVKKETLEKIDKLREKTGKSRGAIIDDAIILIHNFL